LSDLAKILSPLLFRVSETERLLVETKRAVVGGDHLHIVAA
jgi:hypothetical protein